MSKDREKVVVEIYGEKHTIRGSDSPEHIKKVAREVDQKMRLIAERSPRLSAHQIAVLTALNLQDELGKLQEEQETLMNLIGQLEE